MYEVGLVRLPAQSSRSEFRASVSELAALTSTDRPFSAMNYVALGAALVFYRSETYEGINDRYTFQSCFGVCKHVHCDRFFFRPRRGQYAARYCSERCRNCAAESRSRKKSRLQSTRK